jgi:LCP family protein required for cell wall assembly
VAAAAAVFCVAAVGTYAAVNHLESSVHRIPNVFAGMDAAARPIMPAATNNSLTVLLTGTDTPLSANASATANQHLSSGLVMLLHLNANKISGAAVSIPPNAMVAVPGHGTMPVQNALTLGGPSLLIQTVEQLTNVRVDHYAVVDLPHVAKVIDALGGVDVQVPQKTTSMGYTFNAGANHMDGKAALAYVRQPTGINEQDRVQRQQALLRAVITKVGHQHLLSNPVTTFGVLNAFTQALSVDSNFTNTELSNLASELSRLSGSNGVYVTAPTQATGTYKSQPVVFLNTAQSAPLWQAIRNDSVAAFAQKYPNTVTPAAPR